MRSGTNRVQPTTKKSSRSLPGSGSLMMFVREASAFGHMDDDGEGLRLTDCEIGEHLPVEADAGGLQAVDQATVAGAVEPGGGVDTGDPQPAQVTLADSAVAVGIPQALEHRLVRPPEQSVARAPHPARHAKDLVVPAAGDDPTLGTCHVSLSCGPLGAGRPAAPARWLHPTAATGDRCDRLFLEVGCQPATAVPGFGPPQLAGAGQAEALGRRLVSLELDLALGLRFSRHADTPSEFAHTI